MIQDPEDSVPYLLDWILLVHSLWVLQLLCRPSSPQAKQFPGQDMLTQPLLLICKEESRV